MCNCDGFTPKTLEMYNRLYIERDKLAERVSELEQENKTIKRQCTQAITAQADNYETSIRVIYEKHEKEIRELEQEKKILNREFSDEMTDHRKWIEKMLSEQKELHAAIEFWQTLHTQAVNKLYDIAGLVDNVDPLEGVKALVAYSKQLEADYDSACDRNHVLQNERKYLHKRIYKLKEALRASRTIEDGLISDIYSLRQGEKSNLDVISNLKSECEQWRNKYNNLYALCDGDNYSRMKRDIDELHNKLSDANRHIKQATAERDSLKHHCKAFKELADLHEARGAKLEQQLADKDKHIQCLQDEIDALRTACVTTTPAYTPDDYDYESKIADLMVTIRTLSGMVQ